jgi:hypothetical protein
MLLHAMTNADIIGMALLLAFMLVFYALALWDRYIVLKFKEHEKLELRMRCKPPSRSETALLWLLTGSFSLDARLASLPSPPNYGSMESLKRTNNYLTVPPNDRALFGERLPPVTSKTHQTQERERFPIRYVFKD